MLISQLSKLGSPSENGLRRINKAFKTQSQLDHEAYWKAEGFTLIDEGQPEIGRRVEAIRVIQPRSLSGAILLTNYILVPVTRTASGYDDTLNGHFDLASKNFEGWRELRTFTADGRLTEKPDLSNVVCLGDMVDRA